VISDRVFATDPSGVVHAYDAATGAPGWSAATGVAFPIYRDNPGFEYAFQLIGMAEARGVLAVPVGDRLTVFG
jgi:hypothetical protein